MGRRRAPRAPKEKKPKKVNLKLVERVNAGRIVAPYKIIEGLVADHFTDLSEARIAFAWNYAPPKEDGDGQVRMYAIKKGSDLDRNREQQPFDFVILFSHTIWNQRLSENEMMAAVHEALCAIAVCKDKNGEKVVDEMGLTVFRLRKPTVHTFPENVAKFGSWRPEVSKLVDRASDFKDSHRPLLKGINDGPPKERGSQFSEPANKPATNGEANGHSETNGEGTKGKGKRGAAAAAV